MSSKVTFWISFLFLINLLLKINNNPSENAQEYGSSIYLFSPLKAKKNKSNFKAYSILTLLYSSFLKLGLFN